MIKLSRDYIGSADANLVYNEKYKTLAKSKLSEIDGDEKIITESMRRGIIAEPILIEMYLEDLQNEFPYFTFICDKKVRFVHPEYDFIKCECDAVITVCDEDGLCIDQYILEVKTSTIDEVRSENLLPKEYIDQVCHQKFVSGIDRAKVLWSFGTDEDFKNGNYSISSIIDITSSFLYPKRYINKCIKAWEVINKYRDSFENTSNEDNALKYVDKDKFIAAINELNRLESQKKQVENTLSDYKKQIIKAMEENEILSFENDIIKISYVESGKRRSVDTDKLKKDGIYDKYLKETDRAAYVKITRKDND